MQYYLVEMDSDHESFRKFRRFFKKKETSQDGNDPADYIYAGFVKGGEYDDSQYLGQDIYTISDDNDDYPGVEVITLDEWARRFPSEGNLTSLPENYLVELDKDSPIYKEFRHFSIDQTEENIGIEDYEYAGNTESGWLATDDQYDYPECDVLTLEEWKSLRSVHYETY